MKARTARRRTGRCAFTLLEVMFAMVAFCTATFVILALVSNTLANARRLQRPMVDAGAVAAWLSQTNQLEIGVHRVNLGDLLGDAYHNYTCTYDIEPAGTNLSQVDFIVENDRNEAGDNPVVSKMSILLFGRNPQPNP